jgi:hypothetical protein
MSASPTPAPLAAPGFELVTLQPARRVPAEGGGSLRIGIGAHGGDGQTIPAFALERRYGTTRIASTTLLPPPAGGLRGRLRLRPALRHIAGESVFGGIRFRHFGHFLTESLARMWFLRSRPDLPVIWLALEPDRPAWQDGLLELLGIPAERQVLVREPVVAERILVPEPGLVIGSHLHPAQAEAMAIRQFGPPRGRRRLWLSRTGLGQGFESVARESELEAGLLAAGWELLRPETLPLARQLDCLAEAEAIAGFEGSAFHLLLLAAEVRARVLILARRPRHDPTYGIIARAKGLDHALVSPALEPVGGAVELRGRVATRQFALADPEATLRQILAAA